MSQSLLSLWIHLIFSTKDRFPFLKEPELKNDMHRYLASVLRSHDCETLIVGGTSDHIHALFNLSRKYSVATIVKEIKRTSSAWIKEVSPLSKRFHWQNGYGAFSVSNRISIASVDISNNRSITIDALHSRMNIDVF